MIGHEQFKQLASAGELGVVADDAQPVVLVHADLSQTARRLGELAPRMEIFQRNGDLITFDEDGRTRLMTTLQFRTWLSDYVTIADKFDKISGEAIASTLGVEAAATVLASRLFRQGVREVSAVHYVRLPVIRAATDALDWLPWGYDAETKIYTVPGGPEFDRDIDIAAAKAELERMFAAFPFADERSKAVQIAGILSLFVRCLPGGNSLRPGFLWLANKPESGKSVLAKTGLFPVLGRAMAAKMKKDESADKELESFLRAGKPAIFLDNIYGGINSAAIDQMITNSESSFRAMGSHELSEVPNSAQLFVTGNSLSLNEDAARRFLVVDLFEKGDPRDRKVADADILDDDTMRAAEWRSKMLSIACAFVRAWDEGGRPMGSIRMGSFEKYSRLLGGIVESAGFMSPFTPPVIPDAINPEKQDFLDLMAAVAEDMGEDTERNYTLDKLCELARAHQLFQAQIGTQEEGRKLAIKADKLNKDEAAYAVDRGEMTDGQRVSFSKRLKKEVGRTPKIATHVVEFGQRSQARKSTWTIKLSPLPPNP